MRRLPIVGFVCLLLIVDSYLYFRHAAHFFQADSVFLLEHRATSLAGFLRDFVQLHSSGWYRPLANETLTSFLYPIFGLKPVAYRIPVYALFLANSLAVYALGFTLTRRQLAAALGTFYFSIHTANAYTTFDVGFVPELLCTLFYVSSTLAYFRYLRDRSRPALAVSLVCFVASLLSKEMAVTLPGTLIALHLLMNPRSSPIAPRIREALQSSLGHIAIAVMYLIFGFGYLHIAGVGIHSSFARPAERAGGGYYFVLDEAILENADVASSWAFNLPRGYFSSWQQYTAGMVTVAKLFRAFVVILIVALLARPERKPVLAGLAWFFLTLIPALPLLDHFLPYYVFLPVVGASVTVGGCFAFAYDWLRRFQPVLAAAVITIFMGGMLWVSSNSIYHDVHENPLLGLSAEIASVSLEDLKRFYPVLPPKATIYIDDSERPIAWEHSTGALVKMAYNTEDISVLYRSQGQVPPFVVKPEGPVIVLKYTNQHLVDNTERYRRDPNAFLPYKPSEVYSLSLSRSEVIAGHDSYELSIDGTQDVAVRLSYRLDDRPAEIFGARLDERGRAHFDVLPDTRKGTYQFIGFNIEGQPDWFQSTAVITVR